jgi:hypothetical protein
MTDRATRRQPWSVLAFATFLGIALSGCTSAMLAEAPSDPAKPWNPKTAEGTAAATGYGVAPRPEVAVLQPTPGISSTRVYGLPELIDIAQTENPTTRLAWQQARQAALAAGMVEATYLPFVAVNVIAGRQQVAQPLPVSIGSQDSVSTTVEGVSPQIALQWLLFDFGQRGALHKAAKLNADAANVLFNIRRSSTTSRAPICSMTEHAAGSPSRRTISTTACRSWRRPRRVSTRASARRSSSRKLARRLRRRGSAMFRQRARRGMPIRRSLPPWVFRRRRR